MELRRMIYTRPRTARFVSNATPELEAYREKYCRKPESRPFLCSDTRVPIDRPAKGFVQAWNILISRKQRYLPGLKGGEDAEDVMARYYSKELCKLLENGERLDEFDVRLFRKTVELIDVNLGGKLTSCSRQASKSQYSSFHTISRKNSLKPVLAWL